MSPGEAECRALSPGEEEWRCDIEGGGVALCHRGRRGGAVTPGRRSGAVTSVRRSGAVSPMEA